jgi:hypothetical protein
VQPVEEKVKKYKPLIVIARLKTERTYDEVKADLKGQGFTCNEMKAMVREGAYFNGLEVYISKWNYDNHEKWHLYSWKDEDEERVMLGIYEAEQYHPDKKYRKDFEQFVKDWKSDIYDPGMTFTFKESEVEVLEVMQEEVDKIDHEGIKREIRFAKDAKDRINRKKRATKRKYRFKKH